MGGHTTERTPADMARMHERTFRLCAPFSPVQPLVLLVCAAPPFVVKFIMTQQCTRCCQAAPRAVLERPKVKTICLPALQQPGTCTRATCERDWCRGTDSEAGTAKKQHAALRVAATTNERVRTRSSVVDSTAIR